MGFRRRARPGRTGPGNGRRRGATIRCDTFVLVLRGGSWHGRWRGSWHRRWPWRWHRRWMVRRPSRKWIPGLAGQRAWIRGLVGGATGLPSLSRHRHPWRPPLFAGGWRGWRWPRNPPAEPLRQPASSVPLLPQPPSRPAHFSPPQRCRFGAGPRPGLSLPLSPGPGSAARRFHPPRDPPPWVTSFRDASRPRPFLPPQLRHGPSPSVPLGAGSSDCGGCSGAAVPVWAGFGCGPSPRPVAIWPAPGNGRLRPLPPSPVGTPVCCRRWRHSGGTGALLPSPGWDGSHRPTAGCWCPVIPAGPRDWRTTKGCVPLWRCGGAAAAAYGPPSPAAGPWRWSAPAAPHPMAWPWRAPSVWPWPGPVGRWSAVWRRASMGRPMPAA